MRKCSRMVIQHRMPSPSTHWRNYLYQRPPLRLSSWGKMQLPRSQAARSAWDLSWGLGQAKVMSLPTGSMCWWRSCHPFELQEEASGLGRWKIDGIFTKALQRKEPIPPSAQKMGHWSGEWRLTTLGKSEAWFSSCKKTQAPSPPAVADKGPEAPKEGSEWPEHHIHNERKQW